MTPGIGLFVLLALGWNTCYRLYKLLAAVVSAAAARGQKTGLLILKNESEASVVCLVRGYQFLQKEPAVTGSHMWPRSLTDQTILRLRIRLWVRIPPGPPLILASMYQWFLELSCGQLLLAFKK